MYNLAHAAKRKGTQRKRNEQTCKLFDAKGRILLKYSDSYIYMKFVHNLKKLCTVLLYDSSCFEIKMESYFSIVAKLASAGTQFERCFETQLRRIKKGKNERHFD